jgi:hypothetical protein
MKRLHSLLIGIVFIGVACGEDHRREAIIAAKIKERIEDFKTRKITECQKSALDIAITKADSILLKNADLWQIHGDSIPRPPRPTKPGEPTIKVKVDSTPAKPLFPLR